MPSAVLGADEFVDVFARHGRALWMIAAAWVGRGEAQDLVQETARIAWQRRAQCLAGSDVAAWLAQIVRHTGANWRRKLAVQPRDLAELPELVARGDSAPTWPFTRLQEDLPEDLSRALQSLPSVARACLLLHVVVGLSFPEIAKLLDLAENTAMSHARRARLALREALAKPASTPSISTPAALPETS